MHTGGRDLIFMDEYRDEADALARANAAKKSAMASGGTASSNIAVSGADGAGFAGAASALFGASTKSQFIQKDGKHFCFFVTLMRCLLFTRQTSESCS